MATFICKVSQEQALPVLANAWVLDMKVHLYDSFNKHGFNEQTLCTMPIARFWGIS